MTRRRQNNSRTRSKAGRRAAPGQCTVSIPGNRRTITKRTYVYDFEITLGSDNVEPVHISLVELLGADQSTSLVDWYDDFKIASMKLVCTGASGVTAGTVESVVSVADLNEIAPTTYSEVLRMAGAKLQPLNFTQGTMLLGTCRPTFDVTGTSNQYRNAYLTTASTKTPWFGFRVTSTTKGSVTLDCVLTAEVHFRGSQ